MSVRVGAIDCGTNSIRLLIADVDPATGALRDVVRRMEVVRLGHGVDRTGRINPERMAAALAMAREYAAQCRQHGASAVRFVATSASRDAENAADFIGGVEDAFAGMGVSPEVITGTEEASLSFSGATGDLRAAAIPGPYLAVDIGGGSTEFVRGDAHVEAALSIDVGCVRFTERHLHSDPPTAAEVEAARAEVEVAIDEALTVVPGAGVRALVGLAGTVTTVTAHALRLPNYLADRIHLTALPGNEIRVACADLLAMSRTERASLPFMHPGRVDVIGGGALVWSAIVQRVQAVAGDIPVIASEHDILDGIALYAAGVVR